MVTRCGWATTEAMIGYHDVEWGVPVHEDRALFEMLILEGAQAGLSWSTILNKRAGYRAAFDDFDVHAISRYDSAKVDQLLADPGIVRHRLKVRAAIQNARTTLGIQSEYGSFDAYIWRYVGGQPINNSWRHPGEIPPHTAESDAMSVDLKKRGFKFVGPTICYAFMQAVGMVNDHTVGCFRYEQVHVPRPA